MGLFLICPHCQAEMPSSCRTCRQCGAGLGNLPPESQHYFKGTREEAAAAPRSPEMTSGPIQEAGARGLAETCPEMRLPDTAYLAKNKEVSLCEALDRILNKGAVLFGEVVISVANIDLIYLGLQIILASVETARGPKTPMGEGNLGPNLFNRGAFS